MIGRGPRFRGVAVDAAILVPYLVLGLIFVHWGRYNADEGWYSLAAANVYRGEQPYRDFLFTQPPLLPYVYGLFYLILGKSLVVGRLVSLGFGAASVVLFRRACATAGSRAAGVVAGLLLSCNASFVEDTVLVRSQSLTVLWTAVALYGLTRAGARQRIFGSLAGITLAGLTRLSLLPLVAVFALYLWLTEREHRRTLALALAVDAALLIGLAAWFYSGGNLVFGVYTFHQYPGLEVSRWSMLYGMVQYWFADHGVILVAVAWVALGLIQPSRRASARKLGLLGLLGGAYLITTAIHLSRPLVYPEYQTSVVGFAVGFAAIGLTPWLEQLHGRRMIAILFAPLLLIALPGQRFQVDFDGRGGLAGIDRAAAELRKASGGKGSLLTPDTELAFETGLDLLPGYEMSQFSYFGSMDDERARQLVVVNQRRFFADVARAVPDFICITPRYLHIYAGDRSTEVEKMFKAHYELVEMLDGYGQFREQLIILRRR